jgi:hypothetical protein
MTQALCSASLAHYVGGSQCGPSVCDTPTVSGLLPPAADPPEAKRNRFLSIRPQNAGRLTALQVTFISLPPPFDAYEGRSMWAGDPREACELGGFDLDDPCPQCRPETFLAAPLVCQPVFRDWGGDGTVHVYDPAIVPESRYSVRAFASGCSLDDQYAYSASRSIQTSKFGDIAGSYDHNARQWTEADGGVHVTVDAVADLAKFGNRLGCPMKARTDIEPSVLDFKINVTDVVLVVEAFRGRAYPFTAPSPPCP